MKASRLKHHGTNKTVDCTSVLFKSIFTASEIAHRFSGAGTKTEPIINSVIALPAIADIMQLLKNNAVLLWSCHRHAVTRCILL
jgi:hypothetical protein